MRLANNTSKKSDAGYAWRKIILPILFIGLSLITPRLGLSANILPELHIATPLPADETLKNLQLPLQKALNTALPPHRKVRLAITDIASASNHLPQSQYILSQSAVLAEQLIKQYNYVYLAHVNADQFCWFVTRNNSAIKDISQLAQARWAIPTDNNEFSQTCQRTRGDADIRIATSQTQKVSHSEIALFALNQGLVEVIELNSLGHNRREMTEQGLSIIYESRPMPLYVLLSLPDSAANINKLKAELTAYGRSAVGAEWLRKTGGKNLQTNNYQEVQDYLQWLDMDN